jgi:hypothetical protein
MVVGSDEMVEGHEYIDGYRAAVRRLADRNMRLLSEKEHLRRENDELRKTIIRLTHDA